MVAVEAEEGRELVAAHRRNEARADGEVEVVGARGAGVARGAGEVAHARGEAGDARAHELLQEVAGVAVGALQAGQHEALEVEVGEGFDEGLEREEARLVEQPQHRLGARPPLQPHRNLQPRHGPPRPHRARGRGLGQVGFGHVVHAPQGGRLHGVPSPRGVNEGERSVVAGAPCCGPGERVGVPPGDKHVAVSEAREGRDALVGALAGAQEEVHGRPSQPHEEATPPVGRDHRAHAEIVASEGEQARQGPRGAVRFEGEQQEPVVGRRRVGDGAQRQGLGEARGAAAQRGHPALRGGGGVVVGGAEVAGPYEGDAARHGGDGDEGEAQGGEGVCVFGGERLGGGHGLGRAFGAEVHGPRRVEERRVVVGKEVRRRQVVGVAAQTEAEAHGRRRRW